MRWISHFPAAFGHQTACSTFRHGAELAIRIPRDSVHMISYEQTVDQMLGGPITQRRSFGTSMRKTSSHCELMRAIGITAANQRRIP